MKSDTASELGRGIFETLNILDPDDTTTVSTSTDKDITDISYGDKFKQPNVLDPNVVPELAGTEELTYGQEKDE